MTRAESITRLHAIADELTGRGDPWFGECLERLEAGQGLEAFGLFPGWRTLARARRDRVIVQIAAQRFPGRAARDVARIIVRRTDLKAQIGSRVSEDIIRRALAHAPTNNAPTIERNSPHGNTSTTTANHG